MDVNGKQISLGAIATGIALLAQFGAIIYWLATEHANQVELIHRMDAGAARIAREVEIIKAAESAKNASQDAFITKIDEGGSRKLGLVEERLQALTRRVDILERLLEEQRAREELSRTIAQQAWELSRDTSYKVNPKGGPQWQMPPPVQDRPMGPGGGVVVKPPPPQIIQPER